MQAFLMSIGCRHKAALMRQHFHQYYLPATNESNNHLSRQNIRRDNVALINERNGYSIKRSEQKLTILNDQMTNKLRLSLFSDEYIKNSTNQRTDTEKKPIIIRATSTTSSEDIDKIDDNFAIIKCNRISKDDELTIDGNTTMKDGVIVHRSTRKNRSKYDRPRRYSRDNNRNESQL